MTGARRLWARPVPGGRSPTPRWVLWSLVGDRGRVRCLPGGLPLPVRHRQLDAASYMEFATWISQHGSLPIPQDAAAFGHASGITFASAAFYQVGSNIVPQFMAGLPMLLSLGLLGGRRAARGVLGPAARRARRVHVRRPGGAAGRPALGAARRAGHRRSRIPEAVTSAATPTARRSRRSCSSARCRCGSTSQRTDRGEEDAGRWRANWRHHARSASHVLAASPGCCSASRCSSASTGPPTSCSSSRTAAC